MYAATGQKLRGGRNCSWNINFLFVHPTSKFVHRNRAVRIYFCIFLVCSYFLGGEENRKHEHFAEYNFLLQTSKSLPLIKGDKYACIPSYLYAQHCKCKYVHYDLTLDILVNSLMPLLFPVIRNGSIASLIFSFVWKLVFLAYT